MVPCQAEPDPASTEHTVDKFSGVFMGLLKKICPLCAGGALAPPVPPLATPLVYAIVVCLSVCVCLSHSGIVSKQLNVLDHTNKATQ